MKANKNKKYKNIRAGGCVTNFCKMYVQNLKHNIKGAFIFHLILVGSVLNYQCLLTKFSLYGRTFSRLAIARQPRRLIKFIA